MFQADIKAAGLDRRTARTALRTYDQLTQGGAGSKRTAVQLQAERLRAAAQKAEINADLKVKGIGPMRLKTAILAHFFVIVGRNSPRYASLLFLELHPKLRFEVKEFKGQGSAAAQGSGTKA